MQARKGQTMVEIHVTRDKLLEYVRPKVTMGQLVRVNYSLHNDNNYEILQKVKGGWQVITQRPVYVNLCVVRY